MIKLYRFQEYNNQLLNENIVTDIFNKYKYKFDKIIENQLNKISKEKIEKLKKALKPYVELSLEEIQDKIKMKLELNEQNNNNFDQFDPYGEEWDEDEIKKHLIKKRFLKILVNFFGWSLMMSLFTFFLSTVSSILLILSSIISSNEQNFPALSDEIFSFGLNFLPIVALSYIISKLCNILYRRN